MWNAILLAICFAPIEEIITPKISSASLFKNGYSVIVREVPLGGKSEFLIKGIGSSVIGTVWISTTKGVTLHSAESVLQTTKKEENIGSLQEMLLANTGKSITVYTQDKQKFSGVLKSATGEVIVLSDDISTHVIPKAQILYILGAGDFVWKAERTTTERLLKIRASGPSEGKIHVITLEKGITWFPNYTLALITDKKLNIVCKATILNDMEDLEGIELRFVTGFPNIPYLGVPDPFTSGMTIDQFLQALNITQGRVMADATRQALAPGGGLAERNLHTIESPEPQTFQAEDLFLYRIPKVTLKRGERGYYVLLENELPYEHLYVWDIPDSIGKQLEYMDISSLPKDVWHCIEFQNSTSLPWTTGLATMMKEEMVLGQDTMKYTSIGAKALLRITKALDVRADYSEEEIERTRQALKLPNSQVFDLVVLKGTLEIINHKNENIRMRITKEITGEIVSVEGNPEITKIAKGLISVNSRAKLEWDVKVSSGEKKTLTFTYKVYIPQRY